jgi:hypothetical protein
VSRACESIITARKPSNQRRPRQGRRGLEVNIAIPTLVCASSFVAASAVSAHHSASAFDVTTEITVEGIIAELEWKNPHIYFTIETKDADGRIVLRQVEVQPISSVRSFGLTREMLAPGSRIILRANPGRRDPAGTLRGLDITTSDGVIHPLGLAGRNSAQPVAGTAADSLAGFWAVSPTALRSAAREMAAWPLTEAASAALAKVRAGALESQAGCPAYPPPMLDDLPSLRTVEIGDKAVVIRFDSASAQTVRTLHLDRSAHPENVEPSLLGHSIARWEGETLVVDTVAFTPDARGISGIGIPSGPRKRMTERFALAADGHSLRRETTLEDPDYLTAPVSYVMVWDHRPDLDFSSEPEACDPEIANRFLRDL